MVTASSTVAATADVAVLGGGPAGAVCALVLARAGLRALLIDDGRRTERSVGESLPGGARPLLRSIGLLAVAESRAHAVSYGNASAWGSSELESTDFVRDPHGLGFHLDRARFDADLRAEALSAGATHRVGRLRAVVRTRPDDFRFQFADGGAARARFVVDASGRRAKFARSQGARRQRDDALIAVYAWAAARESDCDSRTLIEATEAGWFYTARVPDGTRVLVFHGNADCAAPLIREPGALLTRARDTLHIKNALMGAALLTKPKVVEACGARLDRWTGDDWLATGDAALSFDPLSSQGIFNAMYTGKKAAEALLAPIAERPGAFAQYSQRLEAIRAAYVQNHRAAYAAERRWRDSPFWQERRTRRVPPRGTRSGDG